MATQSAAPRRRPLLQPVDGQQVWRLGSRWTPDLTAGKGAARTRGKAGTGSRQAIATAMVRADVNRQALATVVLAEEIPVAGDRAQVQGIWVRIVVAEAAEIVWATVALQVAGGGLGV